MTRITEKATVQTPHGTFSRKSYRPYTHAAVVLITLASGRTKVKASWGTSANGAARNGASVARSWSRYHSAKVVGVYAVKAAV